MSECPPPQQWEDAPEDSPLPLSLCSCFSEQQGELDSPAGFAALSVLDLNSPSTLLNGFFIGFSLVIVSVLYFR